MAEALLKNIAVEVMSEPGLEISQNKTNDTFPLHPRPRRTDDGGLDDPGSEPVRDATSTLHVITNSMMGVGATKW